MQSLTFKSAYSKKCILLDHDKKMFGAMHFIYYMLLLFSPNVKGKWVDANFQISDLLVPPRAAGVAGTLIFVHIANFATLQP